MNPHNAFILSLLLVLVSSRPLLPQQQHPLQYDTMDNTPIVVRNQKCLAIAKKERKTVIDLLYQKLRCNGIVLPKPKVTKPKVAKKKTTKTKVKKSKVTKVKKPKTGKPKVVNLKVPRIPKPKVAKPKVTKPRVMKSRATKPESKKPKPKPKTTKPNKPKLNTPKLKIPKLAIPKIKKPKVTKPKVTKPKVSKPKVMKPKVTKPRTTKPSKPILNTPKLKIPKLALPKFKKPRVTKPKVTKPKVTKPKMPKLSIPKIPKIPKLKTANIPQLKTPKHPKINPKLIPKVPHIKIKPKKKPSPSPTPRPKKSKSKTSTKRKPAPKKTSTKKKKKPSPTPRSKKSKSKTSTKRKPAPKKTSAKKKKPSPPPRPKNTKSKTSTKRRSAPKKTSMKKPSPRPSPMPSPRPPKPSLNSSLTKLKEGLESAKKRLLKNIEKHEQASRQVCKTEEYACGRKCTGNPGPRFLCHYPNQVPRFCMRKTSKLEFCEGNSGKKCVETVMEPDICTRNVSVTEYCPGAEDGCKYDDIPFGRCLPDACDHIRRKRCDYIERRIVAPCKKPSTSCHDCKSKFLIKTCPKTVKERVTVPCPGENRLPSFEEELLGDGIESMFVRDVLCFDSFFDEGECKHSPRVCRMFNDMFDRHLCASVVCQQCSQLMSMHVSEQVKEVCNNLLQGSCKVAGEFTAVMEIKNVTETCYGTRMVNKQLPCYEKLSRDKICSNGCVVKSCKRTIHEVKGYCERNLPQRCMKHDATGCRRKTKRIRDCSGERICEYVVKKPYLCFREKRVEVPCDGGCEVLKDEQYVCGSEEEEIEAVCREQFDHSCRDLVCTRETCR